MSIVYGKIFFDSFNDVHMAPHNWINIFLDNLLWFGKRRKRFSEEFVKIC